MLMCRDDIGQLSFKKNKHQDEQERRNSLYYDLLPTSVCLFCVLKFSTGPQQKNVNHQLKTVVLLPIVLQGVHSF